jgi:hypothetical protein
VLTTLDPDREEARELLIRELTRAEYNRPESFVMRAMEWLTERLDGLIEVLPGSTGLSSLILGLVLALVVVAIVFVLRGSTRSRRLQDRGAGLVLEEPGLTAEDYRARADAAARSGDWDRVLLDSYRAIAAATEERTLLDELPGTTAHEIAVGLALPFPDHAGALAAAAHRVEAVRYGGAHATQPEAERVRELDRLLSRTRPAGLVAG